MVGIVSFRVPPCPPFSLSLSIRKGREKRTEKKVSFSLVHSWDYRRYLIDSILNLSNDPQRLALRSKPLPEPLPTTETELGFTKKKISENFSNFSAWHYRTKLLSKLWEERGWQSEQHEERQKRVDQGKKKTFSHNLLCKRFETEPETSIESRIRTSEAGYLE